MIKTPPGMKAASFNLDKVMEELETLAKKPLVVWYPDYYLTSQLTLSEEYLFNLIWNQIAIF